jgi:hypothetical protein
MLGRSPAPIPLGSSSPGIRLLRPSAVRSIARPLPKIWAEAPILFGSPVPPEPLVPPSRFRTASTVYSARSPAGLLRPAAGRGVRRVSIECPPESRSDLRRFRQPSPPRAAVHTLRRIPPVHSRTASLRPLPSCAYRLAAHTPSPRDRCQSRSSEDSRRDSTLQGFAPLTSPLRPTPFPAQRRPFLPWALFLSKVRRAPLSA